MAGWTARPFLGSTSDVTNDVHIDIDRVGFEQVRTARPEKRVYGPLSKFFLLKSSKLHPLLR